MSFQMEVTWWDFNVHHLFSGFFLIEEPSFTSKNEEQGF